MKLLTLTLPYPPGFNASYRARAVFNPKSGKWTAKYYKTKVAKDWQAAATTQIAAALVAAKIVPEQGSPFCWFSAYKLKSQRLDADAPQKLIADAIRDAIGHDDSRLASFCGGKSLCKRAEQGLQIWLAGRTVRDDDDFNALSDAIVDEFLLSIDGVTK